MLTALFISRSGNLLLFLSTPVVTTTLVFILDLSQKARSLYWFRSISVLNSQISAFSFLNNFGSFDFWALRILYRIFSACLLSIFCKKLNASSKISMSKWFKILCEDTNSLHICKLLVVKIIHKYTKAWLDLRWPTDNRNILSVTRLKWSECFVQSWFNLKSGSFGKTEQVPAIIIHLLFHDLNRIFFDNLHYLIHLRIGETNF